MARVTRKNDYEHFDRLLSRFKKAVDNDNILRTYAEKEFYQKPTSIRKKSKALAIKRHKKKLHDEQLALSELRIQARK